MSIVTHLDWDTSILGFKTARIDPPRLSFDVLQKTLAELKSEGTRCVYWSSDAEDTLSQQAATACDGILADKKVSFQLPLMHDGIDMPSDVSDYTQKTASAALRELAFAIGKESRFYLDPNMPRDAYQQIYAAWMENSVKHEVADDLMVVSAGDKEIGVVTLVDKGDYGNISLIAVDADYRGQGVGSRLIAAAIHWCVQRSHAYCEVVTQNSNLAACHLYQKNGFSLAHTEHFYHFWL